MMLFNQILALEPEIDKKAQSRSASETEVSNFIESIVDQVNNEQNIDKLDTLLLLYRKWKVLYEKLFRKESELHLSSCEASCKIDQPRNPLPVNELNDRIRMADRTEPISFAVELIGEVNPYFSFHNGINKKHSLNHIPTFSFEKNISKIIKEGVELFKISELYKARKKILKAIDTLEGRTRINNERLYLFAWAYHILGNIAYVQSRYSWAETLFQTSLTIKEQIDNLPISALLATKSKLIYSQSWRLSFSDWYLSLSVFKDELEYYRPADKSNVEWFNNIVIDFNYQLTRCERFMGNIDSARKLSKRAFRLSQEYDDQVGLIKGCLSSGLLSNRYNYWAEKLENLMQNTIDQIKLSNPWVRANLHSPLRNEMKMANPLFSNRVFAIFETYGIKPISKRDMWETE